MCLIAKASEIPSTANRSRRNESLAELGVGIRDRSSPAPRLRKEVRGFERFLLELSPEHAAPRRLSRPLETDAACHRTEPWHRAGQRRTAVAGGWRRG